jgi:CubicO group peptidase (beta-lactamase class C family)
MKTSWPVAESTRQTTWATRFQRVGRCVTGAGSCYNPTSAGCCFGHSDRVVENRSAQMNQNQIVIFFVSSIFVFLPRNAVPQEPAFTPQSLQEATDRLRDEMNLVAVGATLLVDGKIVATSVCGRRHQNSDVTVTVDDKWHLGSITKSITATATGRLVERGQLSWETPLPELLPGIATQIDKSWNSVTLHHMLTHTAGLPANFPVLIQFDWPDNRDALHTRRKEELLKILAQPPASPAGETFLYSNVGYTLIGYIAAETAGTTWEALLEKEVFEPLSLKSAGFGAPKGDQPFDQPWGHMRALFIRSPMDPRHHSDNTPIMGPTGSVHMSMADLSRFGWEHLQGENAELQGETGRSFLLKPETFRKLHRPVKDDYACGWVNAEYDWAAGRVLWHNGSNKMWYSLLMLIPSKNAVFVVVTNDGHISEAHAEFFKLAETVISRLPVQK